MAYQPKSYRKFVAGTVTAAVVASAVAPAASAASFSDVPASSVHAEAINALTEQGIIKGFADGTFGPGKSVSRGQVAKIFARILDGEGKVEQAFSDVPANFADQELVKAASEVKAAGVMTGSNGNLMPASDLTRQQMAKVLVEAFDLEAKDETAELKDLDKAYPEFRDYIKILAQNGVTQVADGNFRPTEKVSRAQFATFVYRAMNVNAGELAITGVTALDDSNKFLEITFNKAVSGLETSDITIQDADTLSKYGVKEVKLSSNGKVATVELYSVEDEGVLEYLQDYKVTVKVDGKTLEATFNRPAYVKNRVSDIDPKNKDFTVGGVTVNVADAEGLNFDYAEALGREVRVWYNEDRELVKYVFEDETVIEDAIEVTETRAGNEDGEIEVKSTGKKYSLAEDFDFYLNDQKVAIGADGAEYDYAKVLFDKNGDVERIVAYNWDDFIVVDKVDGDVVVAADDDELDLEDFVVFKGGKTVKTADLKPGDVIFFDDSSNDGDGVAEVFNSTVTGEIETVYANDLRIDGKDYTYTDVTYNGKQTQYLDGDEFKNLTDDDAEEFQAGGEVTLFLDRNGDVVYITGKQEAVNSNTLGFHSTEAAEYYFNGNLADRGTVELDGLNSKGEEKIYSFRIDSLDQITDAAGNVYETGENFPGTNVEIDKFALVGDGTDVAGNTGKGGNATGVVIALADNGEAILPAGTTDSNWDNAAAEIIDLSTVGADNAFFEVKTNDSNQVKELEFFNSNTTLNSGNLLKLDDKYVNGYKLLSDTVVFDGSEGWDSTKPAGSRYVPDAEDITVTTWGELKDKGFEISSATYYYNDENEVEYLVIENSDAEETTDYNAVLTKVLRNTDSEITEIGAFVNGVEKTYKVDKVKNGALAKGQTVELTINDDSELVKDITAPTTRTGVVATNGVDVQNRTITITGPQAGTYTFANDGDVYDATDVDAVEVDNLRDIKAGDTVTISFAPNSTRFADTVTITSNAAAPTPNVAPTAEVDAVAANDNDDLTLTFSEPLYIGSSAIANGTNVANLFEGTGVSIANATYNTVSGKGVVTFTFATAGGTTATAEVGDSFKAKADIIKDADGAAYVAETVVFNGTTWSK
ncbi:S-layer homology domain-containing protein [Bacillus songklensis]|uniref:S-layer homology domain-containing protein n=1 Tax=Bacillus songklensis TaxID=1069116 RepID=A0ABV8BBF3_9BACI